MQEIQETLKTFKKAFLKIACTFFFFFFLTVKYSAQKQMLSKISYCCSSEADDFDVLRTLQAECRLPQQEKKRNPVRLHQVPLCSHTNFGLCSLPLKCIDSDLYLQLIIRILYNMIIVKTVFMHFASSNAHYSIQYSCFKKERASDNESEGA